MTDTTTYGLVPIKSRPRIVRTSPERGKTSVPLNSLIIVVFSEPMDGASLADALHLRQDGADVPGTAIWELKDGVILSGRFVPTTPLAPLSTYELSVSTAAKSPDGTPLDAGLTVEFTTGASAGLARRFAYVFQGTVLVSNLDGSAPVALADEASRPAWSPDGTRIAFTRPTNDNLAKWQLCVARADGSDARCVVGDEGRRIEGRPSWSPDGSRIAFTIFVHSCPNGALWSIRRLLHEPASTEHRDHGGRYRRHSAAHLSLVVPGWKTRLRSRWASGARSRRVLWESSTRTARRSRFSRHRWVRIPSGR